MTLDDLSEMCSALRSAQQAHEDAKLNLKQAAEQLRLLEEETIPGAMQELGFEKIVLETGEEIKCVQEVYCSIPRAMAHDAHAWLHDHGHGGLIKTEVKVNFGKDEWDDAEAFSYRLHEQGIPHDLGQKVHPQTLKAFVKEQLAQGTDIPLELFGARPVYKAKVK
ncbi:MAG: hypothetical protein EBV86_01315 [Marivivens sp.]|nr:hypothetical protein [Marivivens sp.]NBT49975.1 hypothetical protein [Marivivens sp.]NCW67195.1 hypothetical protein [Marivivens sp.]